MSYDDFDYHFSQDYSEIDHQIDLFEFRQDFKLQKQTEQKLKNLHVRSLKSQPILVKNYCMNDKRTPKAERKSFRYDRYSSKPTIFECDEQYHTKPTSPPSNRAHPMNSEAPMIVSAHGRSFGTGIYCSQTTIYSLSYLNATNTLLVCTAMPPRDKVGKVQRSFGNILVLSREAQIIPLFLMDFKYLKLSNTNYPWFDQPKKLVTEKNEEVKKPVMISRKYLRKVLNMINDQERKNKQCSIHFINVSSYLK